MDNSKKELTAAVKRFKGGDNEALADIYRLSSDSLFVYAKLLMKNNVNAEDLLQDTFIEIIKSIKTLKEPKAFLSWSKTIMLHLAYKEFEKSGKEAPIKKEEDLTVFDDVEDVDTDFKPDENIITAERKKEILKIVESLPVQQRVTMLAFYFDEMSIKDIAGMMEVSENTVKTRLHYARKAVKEKVDKYEKRTGDKLHGITPTQLIFVAMHSLTEGKKYSLSVKAGATIFKHSLKACGIEGVKPAVAASSKGASGATSAAGGVAGIFSGKLVAAVLAVAVAVGGAGYGGYSYIKNQNNSNDIADEQDELAAYGRFCEKKIQGYEASEDNEEEGYFSSKVIDIDKDGLPDYITSIDVLSSTYSLCTYRNGKVYEMPSIDNLHPDVSISTYLAEDEATIMLNAAASSDMTSVDVIIFKYKIGDDGFNLESKKESGVISYYEGKEYEKKHIPDNYSTALLSNGGLDESGEVPKNTEEYLYFGSFDEYRNYLSSYGIINETRGEYTDWKKAYKAHFDELKDSKLSEGDAGFTEDQFMDFEDHGNDAYGPEFRVAKKDVNGDKVPELFVSFYSGGTGDFSQTKYIYTFANGDLRMAPEMYGAWEDDDIGVDKDGNIIALSLSFSANVPGSLAPLECYRLKIGSTGFWVKDHAILPYNDFEFDHPGVANWKTDDNSEEKIDSMKAEMESIKWSKPMNAKEFIKYIDDLCAE